MAKILKSYAIIITTYNRYDDLTFTLKKLLKLGLFNTPIYILDDNSSGNIANPRILKKFSNLKVKKNKSNLGLIVNRNILARWANEDILISLDDDSCFTSKPDFKKLVDYFNLHPNLCATEFDNIEIPNNVGTDSLHNEIIQMYTGFGHAINRRIFNSLNGYREFFVHMCEERDLSQRAWANGYDIRKYSKIKILHLKSPVARIHDKNAYYLARNTLLLNLLNFGFYGFFLSFLKSVAILTLWKPMKRRRFLAFKAIISAYYNYLINL